jgi:hypothetical protein
VNTETWKPIPGYEGVYEVSDLGRVRSMPRRLSDGRMWKGRVLRPTPQPSGHLHVTLSLAGEPSNVLVHRLVLAAFIGPCPVRMEGCHADGDPSNNRLANLRWDTKPANAEDSIAHGTHHQARKTHCPQHHPLEEPNLVPAHLARGFRMCLVCNREHALARYQNRPFDPARADARLAHLMTGAAA